MAQAILQVEHLGKYYKIRHDRRDPYSTLTGTLTESGKEIVRTLLHPVRESRRRNAVEIFKALDDVSFEVNPGDRVGIIGRNGAGKSTLLKLLSRITEPDAGKITLRGRVASLLEVGTGVHPELTGRENIYLNGSILGMKHAEIRRKFDEIVDFSGVEAFLDTPVKRYSSGMYVRLAFAVAAHLEPEILLVDEVLAVGDMEFQKKCLGKMDEISRTEGRTILFVSHNMEAIQRLCNKGILLERGNSTLQTANISEAISYYLSNLETGKTYLSNNPCVDDIYITNSSGDKITKIQSNDEWFLHVKFHTEQTEFEVFLATSLYDENFHPIQRSWGTPFTLLPGNYDFTTSWPGIKLNGGKYFFDIAVFRKNASPLLHEVNCAVLNIVKEEAFFDFPIHNPLELSIYKEEK